MARDSMDITPQEQLEEARKYLAEEEKFMPDGIEGILILFLHSHERREKSENKGFSIYMNSGMNITQSMALVEEAKLHLGQQYLEAYHSKDDE